jgi:hypothetical protein
MGASLSTESHEELGGKVREELACGGVWHLQVAHASPVWKGIIDACLGLKSLGIDFGFYPFDLGVFYVFCCLVCPVVLAQQQKVVAT